MDLSTAIGGYADDLRSKGPPPQLAQALRQLVQPDDAPEPRENVARNVNLTFCWDNPDGIVAGDEAPTLWLDFPCRISGWKIGGKRSETGSATFTVYAGLYADFPTPVSIVASAKPTISSAQKAKGEPIDVATWDITLPRGAGLVAVPDTITGFTKITLSLRAKRLDL